MSILDRTLVLLLWAGIGTGITLATPVPRSGSNPIDADGLRLEICSDLVFDPEYAVDKSGDGYVHLTLTNLTDAARSLPKLQARDRVSLHDCGAISYVVWFPDGSVHHVLQYPAIMSDPRYINAPYHPITMRPRQRLQSRYFFSNTSDEKFRASLKSNHGRFCLTAIAAEVGLQSNTICYNRCPAPPPKYIPLRHVVRTPEEIAQAKLDAEQRLREEGERWYQLELARKAADLLIPFTTPGTIEEP